jgi:nitrite reductase/ring-hydroxylating ferredoxin subunit/multimeric flavodoxin WrbA
MTLKWCDLGYISELKKHKLQHIIAEGIPIALVHKNGEFSAVSGVCNHEKGPLGRGHMEGDYVVCPWHGWHYHRKTGHARPPNYAACLPRHAIKEKGGHLFVNLKPMNKRSFFPHPPHPLSREIRRQPGPLRVVGISTSPMDKVLRRYSTSEHLLEAALKHAGTTLKAQTKLIKLRDLRFHHCGGFYSIDEHACTWPCTFTQFDETDQLSDVYEALVFWADVVLIASPVRWGSASSLYYKMAERLNCMENQMLTRKKILVKNKVVSFVITGGQDNIQLVAGQMMMFFGQLGFLFPQLPFMGHSRGWEAEDMANNVTYVRSSKELHAQARALVDRAAAMSRSLLKK